MLNDEQRLKLKSAGYNDLQINVFEGTQAKTSQQQKQPNYGQRVAENFKAGWDKSKSAFDEIGDVSDPNSTSYKRNPTLNIIKNIGKAGSGAVQAAASPFIAAAEPVIKPTIGAAVNYTADKISNSKSVQKYANSQYGKDLSNVFQTVSDYNDIAGALVSPNAASKATSKVTGAVGNAVDRVASKTSGAVDNVASKFTNTASDITSKVNSKTSGITQTVKDLATIARDSASRIPERVATNVAEKQAFQRTINELPTKVAKEAAQDGLDITDIKSLYSINKSQTAPLKKLAQITKDFAEGKTKTNPIEAVGEPIVNRLKELETQRVKVGSKLGEVAEDLGVVTSNEMYPSVLKRLRDVSGLKDLTVDAKGNLNFKNTVLATLETASDRKAIQSIFSNAIKWGKGKNKHLLRQELFEALGGKKRSKLNLTATQEKAYEAVREGIADVLESKNSNYKKYSSEYRKIVTPLKDMRNAMKVAGVVEDDILDMSAGLLARRLTSLAQSNPQIKAILNAMDNATQVAGKTRTSVEALQDFYNILEKYYDIAPKTGFQAQVKQGVEKATSGPLNYLTEQIKGFAGETPAVRQKALEKILNEILN